MHPFDLGSEILIAELSEIGFESFLIESNSLEAYLPSFMWSPSILNGITLLSNSKFKISYSLIEIEPENWNLKWESNFKSIIINKDCVIRANFHKPLGLRFELVINPKMSFGTGHHETTHMMLEYILELPFIYLEKVLDVGCGTGILAILSEKKGAKHIEAIDVEHCCYENTLENIELNNCKKIIPQHGDVLSLKKNKFDLIIANINKNILLNEISNYVNFLNIGGVLLISGFYEKDFNDINDYCLKKGLKFSDKKIKNKWIAAKFVL